MQAKLATGSWPQQVAHINVTSKSSRKKSQFDLWVCLFTGVQYMCAIHAGFVTWSLA